MDVFLWHARTDGSPERLAEAARRLGADERTRAEGFRFDDDRARFVLARSFLREVLGRHLGVAPEAVRLREASGRKPALDGPDAAAGLDFSLSRSGGIVLCGVVARGRIGVDVERVRSLPDLADVAATAMSAAELASWSAEPARHRERRFFEIWTRKEALGKATGLGISRGPRGLAVPLDVPAGRAVTVAGDDPGERWLLSDLALGEGTAACVVVEAPAAGHGAARCEDTTLGARASSPGGAVTVPDGATLIVRRLVAVTQGGAT
jgi:4'-phosphopantetheinyl transferase